MMYPLPARRLFGGSFFVLVSLTLVTQSTPRSAVVDFAAYTR